MIEKPVRGSPLAIYGAGSTGKFVSKALRGSGFEVACFLDIEAGAGPVCEGVRVFHPESPDLSADFRSSTLVIVAVFNGGASVPAIQRNLKEIGFTRTISFLQLYGDPSIPLGDRYWATSPVHYDGWQEDIELCDRLWADEASRALFREHVRCRRQLDLRLLPCPDPDSHYIPADLPAPRDPMRLIDGGAFDGDTIRKLTSAVNKTEAVAAFEPDSENFSRLVAAAVTGNQSLLGAALYLWPCGLSNRHGLARFSKTGGEGSSLSEEGAVMVQCVALDESMPNFAPTFLKMDIEGAEFEALCGAQRLIRRYRPDLAISVYHRPEHMWQIPNLLGRINPDFRFFLRSHGYNGFETVMYGFADR